MKKNTSKDLASRITKYGGLSLALAGVADLNGQIIYTDIADFNGAGNSLYELDLNNDSTTDFFLATDITSTMGAVLDNWLVASANLATDAILGVDIGFEYPFALNFNDPIMPTPSTGSWVSNQGFQTLNYNGCSYTSSNWCGVTDKYLGLRFTIGTDTHYGWVRLDVNLNVNTGWVVKDYAYNSTPDTGLLAGETPPLSLDQDKLEEVRIVALNKSIGIYNITETTDYNLYALTGQSVLQGSINDRAHSIDANSLQTGIYILELRDKETNGVIRKKVIL